MVKVTQGQYERCSQCEAPMVQPLPEGWTYTTIGLYGLGHLVTPHKPGCPLGFKPAQVPDGQ